MEGSKKIKSFTDLIAWQEAHRSVLEIYKVTETFPNKEIYGISNQMRRAAVSMTSNIAEGFSRQSLKEKIQFYHMTLGSDTELQNQIIIAKDLAYISEENFRNIYEGLIRVNKLINGLIKSLRNL